MCLLDTLHSHPELRVDRTSHSREVPRDQGGTAGPAAPPEGRPHISGRGQPTPEEAYHIACSVPFVSDGIIYDLIEIVFSSPNVEFVAADASPANPFQAIASAGARGLGGYAVFN